MLTTLLCGLGLVTPAIKPAIRIVCCDVDGTLLTPDHTATICTIDTVLRTMEHVTFTTCTGRGRTGAYNALGPIGDALRASNAPGVFLNGLLVYGPDGEVISEQHVETDVVLSVASFADDHGLSLVGFSGERILCTNSDKWTDLFIEIKEPEPIAFGVPWSAILATERVNKLILLGEPSKLAGLRPNLEERLGASASLTCAIPTMLEVLPAGGSKGLGVSALLERLDIPAEAAMAIGECVDGLPLPACAVIVAGGLVAAFTCTLVPFTLARTLALTV